MLQILFLSLLSLFPLSLLCLSLFLYLIDWGWRRAGNGVIVAISMSKMVAKISHALSLSLSLSRCCSITGWCANERLLPLRQIKWWYRDRKASNEIAERSPRWISSLVLLVFRCRYGRICDGFQRRYRVFPRDGVVISGDGQSRWWRWKSRGRFLCWQIDQVWWLASTAAAAAAAIAWIS